MTMTTTGTGMTMETGEVPSPFAYLHTNELADLEVRYRLLLVSSLIGLLYSLLLLVTLEFTLVDFAVVLGTIFLGYRLTKVNSEIFEIKQYLHGEGVPALD